MLDKAGFPLSNTQISNFFLEKEYTDYFRVQEVIGDLVNADLIKFESTHSNTQYSLTAAGKETLGFFKDKITDGIESDVKGFSNLINSNSNRKIPSLPIITKQPAINML